MGVRFQPNVQRAADPLLSIREVQLRQTMALSHCGTWEWDLLENVVIWSPELRRIIGVDDDVQASAEVFMGLIHPDDREWANRTMAESNRCGVAHEVPFRIVRPDGCLRLVKGRATATRYYGGKPAYMVGVIQDMGCADHCEQVAREQEALKRITAREREVLQMVVQGATSKAIAGVLGLSPKTVETYRSRIMSKLCVDDLAGLVRFSIRHELTNP